MRLDGGLLQQIKNNDPRLTSLDLDGQNIGDDGAKALALALERNSSLTSIDLQSNNIGDVGAVALARALERNCPLTSLNLGRNNIGNNGAGALAQVLERGCSLISFNLYLNKIGLTGVQAIAKALASENCRLISIGLHRIELGNSGAKIIAQSLESNRHLSLISLRENGIGDVGAVALAQALERNSSLTSLDLIDNGIESAGATALAQALERNSSLTSLDLMSNKIGDAGAVAFGQVLGRSSLTSIIFDDNGIGDAGAIALAQALERNSSLTSLDLTGSYGSSIKDIRNAGANALVRALERNYSLTSISFCFNIAKNRADAIQTKIEKIINRNRRLVNELIVAIRRGRPADIDHIKKLLAMGVSINQILGNWVQGSQNEGYSPMMIACKYGNVDVVRTLLPYWKNKNKKYWVNIYGSDYEAYKTALDFANERGNTKIIRLLRSVMEYPSSSAASVRAATVDNSGAAAAASAATVDNSSAAAAASAKPIRGKLLAIPGVFRCPLSDVVMSNPMLAADGYSYEHRAIREWLEEHNTSPKTRKPLDHTTLTPNIKLRQAIELYINEMPVIQQRDIQMQREAVDLQAIIQLRDEDVVGKSTIRETEIEQLLITKNKLEKMIAEESKKSARIKAALPTGARVQKEIHAHVAQLAKEAESLQKEMQTRVVQLAKEARDLRLMLTQEATNARGANQATTESLADAARIAEARVVAARGSLSRPATPLAAISAIANAAYNLAPVAIAAITPPEEVTDFLKYIVAGRQYEAEEMLKRNPALVLASWNITDHANRTFNNITGLQYAVWALDWHMWRMIRKHLPLAAAQEQAQGFIHGSWVRAHGEHANWEDLLVALREYVDSFNSWDDDRRKIHWLQRVGRAQKNLPIHVLQEYFHPEREFRPCPNFTDTAALPRDFAKYLVIDELAVKYALVRGWLRGGSLGEPASTGRAPILGAVKVDNHALAKLFEIRSQQRQELIAELTRVVRPRPRRSTGQRR